MDEPNLSISLELTGEQIETIAELGARTSQALRREALTEQAEHSLHSGSHALHILKRSQGELVGYAQVRPTSHGSEVEFLGGMPDVEVLSFITSQLPSMRPLSLWAHGLTLRDTPIALEGFTPARSLFRLSATLPVADPRLPPKGIRIRSFQVGSDETNWIALNRRAFARHPDQGGWTESDLGRRMIEPWFDPKGLLLAERDGVCVAACWTKIHDDPWGRIGEIYVIGVDPSEHGRGLGRFMTLTGLRYLADQGLKSAMLYVESDNEAALALYRSIGFDESWRDVKYEETSGR